MLLLMTQYQFTLIMPNPRSHQKAGTLAPSLLLSSQIPMTQLSTLLAVSALWWESCHWWISSTDAHHRFIAEECDWGFTRFSELRKLLSCFEAQPRPTIEDEAADITVFVRVLEDPTGVLWHNFVKWAFKLSLQSIHWGHHSYDSKKETGYVGLKNQGATCYMNSLLQSLYCTRYFRRVSMSFCRSYTILMCSRLYIRSQQKKIVQQRVFLLLFREYFITYRHQISQSVRSCSNPQLMS